MRAVRSAPGIITGNLDRILEILERDPAIDAIVLEIGTGLRAARWATHEDEITGLLDKLADFAGRSTKPFAVVMHPAHVEAIVARGKELARERGLVVFDSFERAAAAFRDRGGLLGESFARWEVSGAYSRRTRGPSHACASRVAIQNRQPLAARRPTHRDGAARRSAANRKATVGRAAIDDDFAPRHRHGSAHRFVSRRVRPSDRPSYCPRASPASVVEAERFDVNLGIVRIARCALCASTGAAGRSMARLERQLPISERRIEPLPA